MGFLEFNEQTGLSVKTKVNIMQDLKQMFKIAYGQDFEIIEGTEMYTFIDLLSQELAQVGSAAKATYDAYSFTSATGTALDSACSLAGISRKQGESDNALRARYYSYLYSRSVGTVEGIKSRLLQHSFTDTDGYSQNSLDAVVVYNNTNSTPTALTSSINIPAHSIAVVCKHSPILVELENRANDPENLYKETDEAAVATIRRELSEIITTYTSLGCGIVSSSDYSYIKAEPCDLTLSITVGNQGADTYETNAFTRLLRAKILEYVNNLGVGDDVLCLGMDKCVYESCKELGLTVDKYFTTKIVAVGEDEFTTTKYAIDATHYATLLDEHLTITVE